jgi:Glyoxalase-like domain
MATKFQVTIDCANPALLTRFWATALGYRIEDPPAGFDSWNSYWRSIGVPEEDLGDFGGASDSIVDPEGTGPRIWFQLVPETKVVKNRLHFDLDAGGGREVPPERRKERVAAEARRLVAAGATMVHVSEPEGMDHFAVLMQDPEGNEFCVR